LFGPKPVPHAGFVIADDSNRELELSQAGCFRLHEERKTSLDREIAIAAGADQSPWVKLTANVANEFPNRENLVVCKAL